MSSDTKLTGYFLQYARGYKWRFCVAFILMPLSTVLTVVGPALMQLLIDNGIRENKPSYVLKMAFLFLLSVLVLNLVESLQNACLQSAGLRTLRDIRIHLVGKLSFLGRGEYEKRPLGVYVSRSTSDVEAVGETFTQGIAYLLTDGLKIVAIVGYIFVKNIAFGWITLSLLVIVMLMVNYSRLVLRSLFDQIRTLNGQLSAQINECFSMLAEIKNFNLEKSQSKRFAGSSHEYRDVNVKAINLEALIYSVLDALLYLSIGLIFLYVSQFYQKGDELTAGFFVAYIFYLQKLFDPLKEMSGRFAVLQSAFSALGKINSIMDLPLPKDEGAAELKQHDIHIEDLSFSYKEGQSVIKNISLEIPRGTSAAFVGPTGSGKTTMVKLLTRQYDVGEGRILLGGHSLSEYPRELLKKEIVMVPQDPAIFHESVLFNITLNRAEVKKEDVYDICRKIKLDRFIKGLPNGYDTILSEGGKNLSCGQRQLLAMARALASPAEILIFDEATANIDSETESLIQEALDYVMSQKTTIVIAHRLSTIRHTKQIVVLKDGEILEKGSHDELMKEQGLYARMYDIQSMEK